MDYKELINRSRNLNRRWGAERRRSVMLDPYYDYKFMRRWRFRPAKPVRHQPLGRCKRPQAYGRHSAARRQTCPVCGRKLVNTYLRDGQWKCRRCWEEAQKGELVNPIENYRGTLLEGLDAFQRQLKRFDIPFEKING